MPEQKQIGKVFSYFPKIGVAAIEIIDDSLILGDNIQFSGENTDFEQEVDSMQVDGREVQEAKTGKSIGIKVKEIVRRGDIVYKLI